MLFRLEDITYSREGRLVLSHLNLTLEVGTTALVGPSGAGKSTLLRLLNRLADPDAGAIVYRERDLRDYDVLELRREVALVPQLPALLPGSVAENVGFGARLAGRTCDVEEMLTLAGLSPIFADRVALQLSVGEHQRVMLARALALKPAVLVLDEPTTALDVQTRDAVEQTLMDLRDRLAASLIIVTHDPAQAQRLSDRTVALENGHIRGRNPNLGQVAAALALVALAAAVSIWQHADLERDIAVATIRWFIQLTAIGYVIKFIFEQKSLIFVVALIAVMAVFGAFTARERARRVPHAFWPLLIALALAGTTTLGLVVALGVFKPQARYLVPVGGMVIGNAMTAAAVTLNRLGDDVHDNSAQIEATLALGATATQAMRSLITRSLRSGMIPLIDSTKSTGLIFFPGTMVGMLLAGAAPIDAVRLQLILLYVLLGSVALAALTAVLLAYRNFFTPAHQPVDLPVAPDVRRERRVR